MSHHEARMTSKGQITVPVAVREFFGLKAGDIVDFYVNEPTRSVEMIARNRPVSELFGMLNADVDLSGGPVTQRDIDQAIADHLQDEDERTSRQWKERQAFEEWKRGRNPDAAE